MQLIEKTNDTVSEPIGTFEEITLSKDNFDSRFRGPTDYSWLAKAFKLESFLLSSDHLQIFMVKKFTPS